MADEDIERQGDGAEGRRVHDDLRGVIGVVAEFDSKEGRIDRRRNGAVDEEDHGADSRKGAGHQGVGCVYHDQAEEGQDGHLQQADDPYVLVKPVYLRLGQLRSNADHGDGQQRFSGHFHDGPEEEFFGVPACRADEEGRGEEVNHGHAEHDAQRIGSRQPPAAGLIEAEGIERYALDDEDDDLDDHGFGKVGRLAVDDEGVMGKDEDDEGYA